MSHEGTTGVELTNLDKVWYTPLNNTNARAGHVTLSPSSLEAKERLFNRDSKRSIKSSNNISSQGASRGTAVLSKTLLSVCSNHCSITLSGEGK
jgi:hypothetical protein